MTKKAKLVLGIIEDDGDVRNGLVTYFNSLGEFERIISSGSVESFFENDLGDLDVVLTDIGLPGKSGIEGIRLIREKKPDTDIIMLTVFKDDDKIFKSLCAGATGYILKGTSLPEVRDCVFEVVNGGSYMSPAIARKVVQYFRPSAKSNSETLTQREDQIVKALVEGLSYKLIADRLSISIDTVRFHIKSIYRKLQVNSKSEVIAKYFRNTGLG